jgi:hypothetical protein
VGGGGGAGDGGGAAGGGAGGADGGAGGGGAAGGAGGDGTGGGGAAGGAGGAGGGGAAGAGSGGAGGSDACDPDGEADCCPDDPSKTEPGVCGCGTADTDGDVDGVPDCDDAEPHGWNRRITLDGGQIAGALTNFAVLVRIADEHLKGAAAANGGDIYFAAADQTTLLDFEIESYAAETGALVAWVKLPTLSAGADAVLYLGYDDGKTDRADAAGVWSVYRNVWHLGQDPSAGADAVTDSTGRAHGTAQGGMSAASRVAAVAGNGFRFDGSNDQVTFTNDLTGGTPSTLSAWVRQANDPGDNGSAILSFGTGSLNDARFLLSRAEQDRLKCGFYGNDEFATVLPLETWKHVAWVWTGSQSTFVVDGAVVAGPLNHNGATTMGTAGSIGGATFGYDFFLTGALDEVRRTADARSTAWLTTEYANQRPGSTFLKTLGEPAAAPAH